MIVRGESAAGFTDNDAAAITLSDNDDVPIEQPTITSNPNNGDTFQLGEAIEVAMVFPEIVYVDTSGGTPTITLSFGTASSGSGKPALTMLTAANEEERLASYVSGSGTRELVFAYINSGRGLQCDRHFGDGKQPLVQRREDPGWGLQLCGDDTRPYGHGV